MLGPLVVLLSMAQLAVVGGLWTLQPWAWTWAMILYGVDLLVDLLSLLLGDPSGIVGAIIAGVVPAYVYSKRDYYR